jgi:hypothetical protein
MIFLGQNEKAGKNRRVPRGNSARLKKRIEQKERLSKPVKPATGFSITGATQKNYRREVIPFIV